MNAIDVAQNIKQKVLLVIDYSLLTSVYSITENTLDFLLEQCFTVS